MWAGFSDFYARYAGREVLAENLFASLQARTAVDVATYVEQFTRRNAAIDLSIAEVAISPDAGRWISTVQILVESDRDYELTTAVEVRNAAGEAKTKPIRLSGRGPHEVVVTSSAKPEHLRVDPEFRVPQTNIENDIWSAVSTS